MKCFRKWLTPTILPIVSRSIIVIRCTSRFYSTNLDDLVKSAFFSYVLSTLARGFLSGRWMARSSYFGCVLDAVARKSSESVGIRKLATRPQYRYHQVAGTSKLEPRNWQVPATGFPINTSPWITIRQTGASLTTRALINHHWRTRVSTLA